MKNINIIISCFILPLTYYFQIGDTWNDCKSECIVVNVRGRNITSIVTLSYGCQNGGTCNSENICVCLPGFDDPHCTLSMYTIVIDVVIIIMLL